MTVTVFDPFTVALTCTQAFLFFLSFLVVVVLFFFFFLEGGRGKEIIYRKGMIADYVCIFSEFRLR